MEQVEELSYAYNRIERVKIDTQVAESTLLTLAFLSGIKDPLRPTDKLSNFDDIYIAFRRAMDEYIQSELQNFRSSLDSLSLKPLQRQELEISFVNTLELRLSLCRSQEKVMRSVEEGKKLANLLPPCAQEEQVRPAHAFIREVKDRFSRLKILFMRKKDKIYSNVLSLQEALNSPGLARERVIEAGIFHSLQTAGITAEPSRVFPIISTF